MQKTNWAYDKDQHLWTSQRLYLNIRTKGRRCCLGILHQCSNPWSLQYKCKHQELKLSHFQCHTGHNQSSLQSPLSSKTETGRKWRKSAALNLIFAIWTPKFFYCDLFTERITSSWVAFSVGSCKKKACTHNAVLVQEGGRKERDVVSHGIPSCCICIYTWPVSPSASVTSTASRTPASSSSSSSPGSATKLKTSFTIQ